MLLCGDEAVGANPLFAVPAPFEFAAEVGNEFAHLVHLPLHVLDHLLQFPFTGRGFTPFGAIMVATAFELFTQDVGLALRILGLFGHSRRVKVLGGLHEVVNLSFQFTPATILPPVAVMFATTAMFAGKRIPARAFLVTLPGVVALRFRMLSFGIATGVAVAFARSFTTGDAGAGFFELATQAGDIFFATVLFGLLQLFFDLMKARRDLLTHPCHGFGVDVATFSRLGTFPARAFTFLAFARFAGFARAFVTAVAGRFATLGFFFLSKGGLSEAAGEAEEGDDRQMSCFHDQIVFSVDLGSIGLGARVVKSLFVKHSIHPNAFSGLVFCGFSETLRRTLLMKTVLLIDDDMVVRKVVSKALTSAGWKVFEAEDGTDGIKQALEIKPAVVICDLLMPGSNGFHVCRKLREHANELPDLRIIVTTFRAFDIDRRNALESGADWFFLKPVAPKVLLHAMESDTRRMTKDEAMGSPTAIPDAAEIKGQNFLRFWGIRGSIPTPGPSTVIYGGNTSCVEVRADGELIILDAGSGLRELGTQLTREFSTRALSINLLLTHTHWDHIQGFPFFPPAYNNVNQVRVLGYEGSRKHLETTFAVQMDSPFFPIGLKQMPGHVAFEELNEMDFNLGKVRVRAIFVNHPGVTVGYRLDFSTGSIVYVPDHESYARMRLHPNKSPEDDGQTKDFALREAEKFVEFIRGADVLILDSQYTAEEYEAHLGWGHSCFEDTVETAIIAEVRRLFLFHHDPGHNDDFVSEMVRKARGPATARGSSLVIESAREGLESVLE